MIFGVLTLKPCCSSITGSLYLATEPCGSSLFNVNMQ